MCGRVMRKKKKSEGKGDGEESVEEQEEEEGNAKGEVVELCCQNLTKQGNGKEHFTRRDKDLKYQGKRSEEEEEEEERTKVKVVGLYVFRETDKKIFSREAQTRDRQTDRQRG